MAPADDATLWLLHGADPERSDGAPDTQLSVAKAERLIDKAATHGVLPAVLRKFEPVHADDRFSGVRRLARAKRDAAAAHSLMLRTHSKLIATSMQGLPVTMIKGATFAQALYPQPFLRTFTDIDLLVPVDARRAVAGRLDSLGFWLAEESRDSSEQKWLSRHDGSVMVELHTNLVHSPRMRRKFSLSHEDLASASPWAGYLVTAAVHGAIDGFRQLRQVVDLCQAARRLPLSDERDLDLLLARSRAHLALIVGLELAFGLFGDPRCRDIAAAIQTTSRKKRAAALMQQVVGRLPYGDVAPFSTVWRRRACRMLLRSA